MKKYLIRIDTQTDVMKFVSITTAIEGATITVTDNNRMRVNARSLLGVLYALEFEEIWCESDIEIYDKIKEFVI